MLAIQNLKRWSNTESGVVKVVWCECMCLVLLIQIYTFWRNIQYTLFIYA